MTVTAQTGSGRPADTQLHQVLVDLAAEGNQLESMVAGLDDAGWRTATPAAGWDIAHQVAHLAWTAEAALAAATDKAAWDELVLAAMDDPDGFVDSAAAEGAAAGPDLLTRWRSPRPALAEALLGVNEGEKIPWFGPPMGPTSMATARFMETWAHARDVADALGAQLPLDDRVRHVVHIGVRTRDFAFTNHGLAPPAEEFRVDLVLPSGELLTYGSLDAAQSVRGSAYDFALLVTQRIWRPECDLAATGRDADVWLDIAQAFAGPSGPGRGPR